MKEILGVMDFDGGYTTYMFVKTHHVFKKGELILYKLFFTKPALSIEKVGWGG